MKTNVKKQDYINEILRLNRVLTQTKYDADDDRNIKRLIAENLQNLAEIEKEAVEAREKAKAKKELERYQSCLKRS